LLLLTSNTIGAGSNLSTSTEATMVERVLEWFLHAKRYLPHPTVINYVPGISSVAIVFLEIFCVPRSCMIHSIHSMYRNLSMAIAIQVSDYLLHIKAKVIQQICRLHKLAPIVQVLEAASHVQQAHRGNKSAWSNSVMHLRRKLSYITTLETLRPSDG
jgi:hypothetical protein